MQCLAHGLCLKMIAFLSFNTPHTLEINPSFDPGNSHTDSNIEKIKVSF